MLEREIILLLKKVSGQLEEVLANQEDLKRELLLLKGEVALFQKDSITDIEERMLAIDAGPFH